MERRHSGYGIKYQRRKPPFPLCFIYTFVIRKQTYKRRKDVEKITAAGIKKSRKAMKKQRKEDNQAIQTHWQNCHFLIFAAKILKRVCGFKIGLPPLKNLPFSETFVTGMRIVG